MGSKEEDHQRKATIPVGSTSVGASQDHQRVPVPVLGNNWWQCAMLVPKMPGAPMFQSKDVLEFMEVMESLFQRHYVVTSHDKLAYLPDYCQSAIMMWLKSLDEY